MKKKKSIFGGKMLSGMMIGVVLLQCFCVMPAYANSARSYWSGTTLSGAVVKEAICPVEIEKENLTFKIEEFPLKSDENWNTAEYHGEVKAEYMFYNPADYEVTVKLAFPFGNRPEYWNLLQENKENVSIFDRIDKYDIKVNGEKIEKEIRHSWFPEGSVFETEHEMEKLRDGYKKDAFYSPNMKVTCYTYEAGGMNQDENCLCAAGLVWKEDPSRTRMILEECSGEMRGDQSHQFIMPVHDGKEICIYVIGDPIQNAIEWNFYETMGIIKKTEGSMTLKKEETMSLEEFIFRDYSQDEGISKVDWYNASVDRMIDRSGTQGVFFCNKNPGRQLKKDVMRWFQYEFTIGPGEQVVNTVKAPIYPAVNKDKVPFRYEYDYLMSPAKTWVKFGPIQINIETPYELMETNLMEFRKTEGGYQAELTELPDGELNFVLSEGNEIFEEKPHENKKTNAYMVVSVYLFMTIGIFLLIVAGIAVYRKIRRRKNME